MDILNAKHFLLNVRLARDEVTSFNEYPFCLPAIRTLDTLTLHPKVTFLIGENGAGKSTLIEAIAVALGLNAEGGSRNFHFATRASHSDLHKFLVLRRGSRRPKDCFFLRAESYFNVATEIERLDREPANAPLISASYGNRPLHEQSHGESFLALFQNRFFGQGLYLLDEPEAALSPVRQMSFVSALHELVEGGSQFIIATHSPVIMAYPDAWIYVLGESGVRRVPYKATEHYKVTRDFLLRTEQMLAILMGKPRIRCVLSSRITTRMGCPPMRRIARHLFTVLSAVSLLLCVVVCVLWLASYWRAYLLVYGDYDGRMHASAYIGRGELFIDKIHGMSSHGVGWRIVRFSDADPVVYQWDLLPGLKSGFGYTKASGGGLRSIAVPLWFVCVMAAVGPLLSVLRRRARRRLRAQGLCSVCGYDMRASPERCPECGILSPQKATA